MTLGTEVTLMQITPDDGLLHPVCYHSSQLLPHERAYTMVKELLSHINALKTFECYVYGVHPLVVYTNHIPLHFLDKYRYINQRLLRWSLFLQLCSQEIPYVKCSENILAYTLAQAYFPVSADIL